jgi:transposase
MIVLFGVKVNTFYSLVERLCWLAGLKNTISCFSKQMYGNVRLAFLVCYKEKLNVSYRRFVEICEENGVQRMLCVKRVPHFSTLQKFVQRTPKALFEGLVRACRKLLNLKDIEACVDGTGFGNTNPSHYYCKRIDGKKVRNFTKTVLLTDNKTKLVLNMRTHSDNTNETLDFIPLIKQLSHALKTVLADRQYDSMKNREYCKKHGITVQVPFRRIPQSRQQELGTPSKRKQWEKQFNPKSYKQRALIESINSAIKRTLGSWVCSRKPENQQKNVTIKAIAYNIEHIGRTLKIRLFITC